MEESRKEEKAGEEEKKRPIVTIAPAAPEREMPKAHTEEGEQVACATCLVASISSIARPYQN